MPIHRSVPAPRQLPLEHALTRAVDLRAHVCQLSESEFYEADLSSRLRSDLSSLAAARRRRFLGSRTYSPKLSDRMELWYPLFVLSRNLRFEQFVRIFFPRRHTSLVSCREGSELESNGLKPDHE